MEKKNLDLYKEKYKDISSNQIKRIKKFLEENNFSSKDFKKFDDEFNRILNIKKETIKLVFDIIPESTPRPRLNFRNGNFYVKNAHSNNEFIRVLVEKEELLQNLIYTPCEFMCKLYFPIPSGMNKVEKLLAEVGVIKPPINKDWDNLGKTYSDMVQKWLLLNDSLITKGISEKYWSLKPRVEIYITYLIVFDCKFNKRLVESTKAYKGKK